MEGGPFHLADDASRSADILASVDAAWCSCAAELMSRTGVARAHVSCKAGDRPPYLAIKDGLAKLGMINARMPKWVGVGGVMAGPHILRKIM